MLLIDGKELGPLQFRSYTDVNLKPGSYTVALRPSGLDSRIWQGDWRMTVEAGRVYFLALWNDVEHYRGTTLVPLGSGVFLPMGSNEVRNSAVRSELVAEADAIPVMSELTYFAPRTAGFDSSGN